MVGGRDVARDALELPRHEFHVRAERMLEAEVVQHHGVEGPGPLTDAVEDLLGEVLQFGKLFGEDR